MKKKFYTLLFVCVSSIIAFALTACGSKAISGTITVNKTLVALEYGDTVQLSAQFTPDDETEDVSAVTVTWSSDKENVASVDQNGVVTTKIPGKAVITASYGEVKASCDVHVYDPDQREAVEIEDARINISNHQNKMSINLKRKFGHEFEAGDVLVEIQDEQGQKIPFFYTTDGCIVNWTGAVGMHTWTFYTKYKEITTEVCHASHIVAKVEDYGPLSADWDVAVAGNTANSLAHQNATKDWYVVLDDNLDLGMALRDSEEYTFGREYSPGTYNAPNRKIAVFNGTFDGRGYAIQNMHTRQGFICNLGTTGVIKNVAFVQCRNGEGIPYYDVDGGFLGHSGLGTVENVFIDAYLYYEDGTASAMYCHTNEVSPLRVKNCLVMFYKKPGAENWGWADGNYRLPGAFCTYGSPQITNSYAISAHFTRADGNSETSPLVYTSYEAWIESGVWSGFKGLWEIGEKTIFFGGTQVFLIKD